MSLFKTEGVVKRFGGLLATDNVSLTVEKGEIHALIGPNGAGKSTLVNLISGLIPADQGRTVLDGKDITGMPSHLRVRAGMARCFQVTNIFRDDTVLNNLMLAVQAHSGTSFRFLSRRSNELLLQENAEQLAAKLDLTQHLHRIAGTLPHGVQRKLDVALALASRPKLLLLDEPMAGMGPEDSLQMVGIIRELRKETTILLIEHDMDAVFQLADRISVLVYGRILTSGTADEIRNHPQVQEVYLGTEDDAVEAMV